MVKKDLYTFEVREIIEATLAWEPPPIVRDFIASLTMAVLAKNKDGKYNADKVKDFAHDLNAVIFKYYED